MDWRDIKELLLRTPLPGRWWASKQVEYSLFEAAITGVRNLGRMDAYEDLIVALDHFSGEVRREAANAMNALRRPEAIGPLCDVIARYDEIPREHFRWQTSKCDGYSYDEESGPVQALTQLLTQSATSASDDALEKVVKLNDQVWECVDGGLYKAYSFGFMLCPSLQSKYWKVDATKAKSIASGELARRHSGLRRM